MRAPSALVSAALAGAALVLVTGCGAGEAPDPSSPSPSASESAAPTPTGEPSPTPSTVAASDQALVARPSEDVSVFSAADVDSSSQVLSATTDFGSARAMLVLAEQGEWLRVALPTRPNGSSGWVRKADVDVRVVDEAVQIDLAARTLTLLDAGKPLVTTPVAIGDADHPTPTGEFYVVDKLDTGNDASPYGRFALGLSAHSDVLTEFAGGDGQVGIHGTNDPSSIGKAASHGCIRVPADVASLLAEVVHLGTPISIA